MGIPPLVLDELQGFMRRGILPPGGSVAEIGSQEIHCHDDPAAVKRLLQAGGVDADDDLTARLARGGGARELFTLLGFRYASFDIDGMFGAEQLDLNFDSVPERELGRFDLVTNNGTTEHLANQVNAFRFIHDLTRLGGVMHHVLPFTGYLTHGLVNYTPKFFWMLCKSNGYELLSMRTYVKEELERINTAEVLGAPGEPAGELSFQDSCLIVAMRRMSSAAFVPPVDGDLSKAPERIRRHYLAPEAESGLDVGLYRLRAEEFGPEYAARFRAWLASPSVEALAALEAAYAACASRFPASADLAAGIDLSGSLLGLGWGLAETNALGQKWRWIGPSGESSLFVNQAGGPPAELWTRIHTAAGESLYALRVDVDGTPAENQTIERRGDAFHHRCVLPGRGGAVRIRYRLEGGNGKTGAPGKLIALADAGVRP